MRGAQAPRTTNFRLMPAATIRPVQPEDIPAIARARRRRYDGAIAVQPVTTLSERSIARSTRSSSWPRRTISPVAEITL